MKKVIIVMMCLVVLVGGCSHYIHLISENRDVQAENEELKDRIKNLEEDVDSLHLDVIVLQGEVESIHFRIVQAFELIMSERPDIDRSLAFKIAHTTVIISDNYGIDHFLVLALMKQESNFNPRARSKACVRTEGQLHCGARGLMQVMTFWANDYGVSSRNDYAELYDIETNIDTGVGILETELTDCGWDVRCALGKYHGSYPKRGKGSYAHSVYDCIYPRYLKEYNKGESFFEPLPFEDDLEVFDGDTL